MELGQNAQFTLLILVWGWCLAAKGHELRAGAVWGLLAFKPVWAVAFLLVPIVLRRWRMLFGMVAAVVTGGCVFCYLFRLNVQETILSVGILMGTAWILQVVVFAILLSKRLHAA